MSGGFASPKLSVEVAFTNNPYDSSLTWTDITRYVQSLQTGPMGRQHELQQVNPTTATIQLYNGPVSTADPGGRFSPWNSGGPYFYSGTGIDVGHPVKITATWSGTTYPVFYGYTQSWTPTYGQSSSVMTLKCYDILALLNLDTLDQGAYESTIMADSPTGYWICGDAPGSRDFADSSGNGYNGGLIGQSRFGGSPPFLTDTTTSFGTSHTGMMVSSVAPFPSSGDIMLEGWFKTSSVSQVLMQWGCGFSGGTYFIAGVLVDNSGYASVFYGAAGSIPSGEFVTGPQINDGKWHHICVQVPCGTQDDPYFLYVDGVACGSGGPGLGFTLDSTFPVAFGGALNPSYGPFGNLLGLDPQPQLTGNMAQIAYYPSPLQYSDILNHYTIGSVAWSVEDSGSRIAAVLDAVGVPAALNNVGPGLIQCQGATSSLATTTVMSYINTVVNTERGLFWQDASGVLQYANREYVYTNASSTTSQATFGYASGQLHYLATGLVPGKDDEDLWNVIPVAAQGGATVTASDATSITKYGRRTLTGYTSLLFANQQDALDLAEGLLYQYKQTAPRIRALTVTSTISAGAAVPQMLGRKLLDRITVNWRPMDGSTVDFSQQSLIEGVSHSYDAQSLVWTTTFALTPIGTESFGLYGTGTYGSAIYGF